MGIRRAARPGARLTIPLMCDPLYQERRGDCDRGTLLASEELFRETLDASVLVVPLDGVTMVTIQGLSGQAFEDIDGRVAPELFSTPVRAAFRRQAETVRAGLVAIAIDGGTSALLPAGYDVEALANDCGELWPALRAELDARIRTLSHLGPSAGSSSAPSSGEPTQTDKG